MSAEKINTKAMNKLSYGLFVLAARDGEKDNGCIVNTVTQVTTSPNRISVAVNNANLTCEMIARTDCFSVSVLDVTAPFEIFKHFGFQSGRDADKFAGWEYSARDEAGVLHLTACANAWMSAKVVSATRLETHTIFLAEVTEAQVLGSEESLTYAYYHANVKPQRAPAPEKKKGYVCKVCGYVYEGDTLPDDFVCPLCKHGPEDFEPIK